MNKEHGTVLSSGVAITDCGTADGRIGYNFIPAGYVFDGTDWVLKDKHKGNIAEYINQNPVTKVHFNADIDRSLVFSGVAPHSIYVYFSTYTNVDLTITVVGSNGITYSKTVSPSAESQSFKTPPIFYDVVTVLLSTAFVLRNISTCPILDKTNSSSVISSLSVDSVKGGLVVPRLTSSQLIGLHSDTNPVPDGSIFYNSSLGNLCVKSHGGWDGAIVSNPFRTFKQTLTRIIYNDDIEAMRTHPHVLVSAQEITHFSKVLYTGNFPNRGTVICKDIKINTPTLIVFSSTNSNNILRIKYLSSGVVVEEDIVTTHVSHSSFKAEYIYSIIVDNKDADVDDFSIDLDGLNHGYILPSRILIDFRARGIMTEGGIFMNLNNSLHNDVLVASPRNNENIFYRDTGFCTQDNAPDDDILLPYSNIVSLLSTIPQDMGDEKIMKVFFEYTVAY